MRAHSRRSLPSACRMTASMVVILVSGVLGVPRTVSAEVIFGFEIRRDPRPGESPIFDWDVVKPNGETVRGHFTGGEGVIDRTLTAIDLAADINMAVGQTVANPTGPLVELQEGYTPSVAPKFRTPGFIGTFLQGISPPIAGLAMINPDP